MTIDGNTRATHTPGPWRIGDYQKIVDANGATIRLCGVSIAMSGSDESMAEARANDLLVAAAPDLLEACKLVGQVLMRVGDGTGHLRYGRAISEAYGVVRAAIARAEGGAL